MTPLDSLRQILSDFVPSDEDFARRLSQKMGEIGKSSLVALGDYLKKPGTSALRKAVLPVIAKHDWPEWSHLLFEILSKEPELAVFDDGCRALGSLGTKSTWKALQRLKTVRANRDHQIILDRELNELSARQPLSYYLGRILEGENNPSLAAMGARMVAVMASPTDIGEIMQTFQEGDKLAKQQLLRILPCITCAETTSFLAYSLKNSATEIVESKKLLDIMTRLNQMPRPSARQECQNLVGELFRDQAKGLVGELNIALGQDDGDTSHLFDAMEEFATTTASTFMLEALRLLVEGKLARFSVVITERTEEIEKRIEELEVILEHSAAALARLVKEGGVESSEAIPYFTEVFKMHLGGNLFLDSYASIVSHHDTDVLDGFLAEPDFKRRFVLFDTIGAKEDEHFVDFFLKAVRDSIIDVGQHAVQHMGKLRRGQETFLEYFKSGDAEKMRLALWGFKEIQLQEASEILIDFIRKDLEGESPEVKGDLLVEAANALSSLRVAKAAPILLQMLHDGQPLKLQIALSEALTTLQLPEVAIGLLTKAKILKHTEVLFIVLEGTLPPFNSFGNPFPTENFDDLMSLLERCYGDREGEGQKFRALCAMEHLFVLDMPIYEKLQERISDYLSHMRAGENWDKGENDTLTAILKELAKRCESLKVLNQKETELTNLMQRTATKGPHRAEAIQSLRSMLEDPDLILKAEMARSISAYVQAQLKLSGKDWKEQAQLCEIAGLCRQKELIDPIKMIYNRATGLGLKSAARNALNRLGLSEADINRRGSISSILVVEPSAFFRKRLVEALNSKKTWEVREAGSKIEAENLLKVSETDLLISECIEVEGGLLNWFDSMWENNRLKYVYLCTSNRDVSGLGEPAWLIGVLHKPFPMEKLLEDIKD
ncbi:MAG: HEAT repeat domain-containing protein [Holophagaceae bacterium]|nr:HEAT repeat domain-containing protein [Holophagaceae bacterium]